MAGKRHARVAKADTSLGSLAGPNPDCSDDFNRFAAGNPRVVEWTGKHEHIRRQYCSTCGHRFSERQGSLLEAAKLRATVVRIVKYLGHGCSIEATADTSEVDTRSVERIPERARHRAGLPSPAGGEAGTATRGVPARRAARPGQSDPAGKGGEVQRRFGLVAHVAAWVAPGSCGLGRCQSVSDRPAHRAADAGDGRATGRLGRLVWGRGAAGTAGAAGRRPPALRRNQSHNCRKSVKVTPEQKEATRRLKAEDEKVAAIARAIGVARPTIYSAIDGQT